MGRDQNDTAARVVHHNAGIRLSPKASTDQIRAAIGKVLAQNQYRVAAERLAGAIAAERETSTLEQISKDLGPSGQLVTTDSDGDLTASLPLHHVGIGRPDGFLQRSIATGCAACDGAIGQRLRSR